jgi:hypothetical protein
MKKKTRIKIRPLTPDLWPALEDLFDTKGPCSRCWCMYWRIGAAYRHRLPEESKAAFHQIVEAGSPPGLLAFIGNQAVGWCQLIPRDELPQLDREWRLKRIDQQPVWSISCFYIRIGFRRKGVTSALIAVALQAAKAAHAPALEAYPLDAEKTPSTSSTGHVTTFARADFEIIATHTPAIKPACCDRRVVGKSAGVSPENPLVHSRHALLTSWKTQVFISITFQSELVLALYDSVLSNCSATPRPCSISWFSSDLCSRASTAIGKNHYR